MTITIPTEKLPEIRTWRVGKTYRVKLVLKQVAMEENSGTFEIIDATSLEPVDKANQAFLNSDSGMYVGDK
jgi:hypothetical protein